MLATLWRALLAVCDVRRALRLLTDKPRLDVVFVTNIRDEAERRRFFSASANRMQHASGPRMHLGGVAAQVRGINFTAEEMVSREGRKKAKLVFIEAVKWAEAQGARVVLLAASTKRLFGRDGAELKALFPKLVFTIGDNGTAQLLCADIDRAIEQSGLKRLRPRILVIGPYGILGSAVSRHLMKAGHEVVGFGSTPKLLNDFAAETGMKVCHELREAGHFDMVVACTHSAEAKLTLEQVQWLRRAQRKLLVVDVAEPANLDAPTYARCRSAVLRQDAGNGHSPLLRYVAGPLSWSKLQLSRGTVFGCFAEAMALYHAIYREHSPVALTRDWFVVDERNTALVREAFASLQIGLPAPHCFGRPVHSFDLKQQRPELPKQPALLGQGSSSSNSSF
ncbi:hypothetical protein RQP53_01280 [Paucibacter sp. APW11]|uniref:Quinate/shikimate 5-dehydrogenase/glutamyl-tRNA reductase domain-containing protein n=1 Tax=Roseateles aquae TaxID=3077235 RepID=A0ABU3P5P3_9BURK|nr:NAD(P)-binding domain-containing protein [Paucibacter sp. APW11]MDT8997902.1 hypothetical protein [Paucibacter sp. APW11]